MMKMIFNKFAYEEVHMIVSSILMIIPIAIISVGVYIPETPFMMYIISCWSFEPPVMHILYDYYKDKKNIIDETESRGKKIMKKKLRNIRIKKTVIKVINLALYFLMVAFLLLALCAACGWLIKLIVALFHITL